MKDKWLDEFKTELKRLGTERVETKAETLKLRPGERRTVTILFLDLKGFTSMSEQLDPEELHAIIDPCFKIFTKDIERCGGYIDKYEGDCIMALFGAQKSSEFDAQLAARSALLMHGHLEEINQVLQERDLKLGMRIGINTGLVATGPVGKERPGDFTVYGDAVNLASRLESNAPVGKILVSDEVQRQIKDKFECQSQGTIQVKGKTEPVKVFTVDGERDQGIERWDRSCLFADAPLVDRISEMENIQRWFAAVPSPSQAKAVPIFTIQGAAGIGKSRLMNECLRRLPAKAEPKIYFRTRCIPFESSYFPFIMLAGQIVEYLKTAEIASGHNGLLQKLGEGLPSNDQKIYLNHLPYLAHLLGTSSPEPLTEDPRERQLKFQLAIRFFFQALVNFGHQRNTQFVLVFDDVQWIDIASREALLFLLDQVHSEAWRGIIIIFRDGYDFNSFLPSTLPCSLLHLGPLGEDHCQELIEKIIGLGAIPHPIVENILQLCQGNPYFLEEMLLALHERNYLVNEAGTWKWTGPSSQIPIPMTLESLLLNKIDTLPKPLKETLHVASVLGRRFEKSLLTHILQHLGLSGADADNNLHLLCHLGLVYQEPASPQAFFFAQNLFHQVVYQSLLVANRKILHRLAAESYPQQTKNEKEANCQFIAHHFLRSDHPQLALPSLVLAVQHLVRDFRMDDARIYADQGFDLLAKRELSAQEKSFEWSLLLDREKIAELTNDNQARKKILDRIQELALAAGDAKKIAEAGNMRAWYAIDIGQYEVAIQETRKVLDAPEIKTTALEADAHHYQGLSHYNLGNYDQAEKRLKDALLLRRWLGDELGESRELSSIGTILWQHSEYREAIENLKSSLQIRKQKGDLRGMAHVMNNLGLISWSIGELSIAAKYYEQALSIYQQIGDRRGEGNTLSNLSLVFYYRNQLLEAQDYAREALALAQKYELFRAKINGRIYLAMILMDLKELAKAEEVRELLNSAIYDATAANYFQGIMEGSSIKAEMLRQEGRLEAAYELSLKAMELMISLGAESEDVYWTHAQIVAGLNQPEEAERTLARAYEMVKTRLEKIRDPEAKKLFISGNPYRVKIMEWQAKNQAS